MWTVLAYGFLLLVVLQMVAATLVRRDAIEIGMRHPEAWFRAVMFPVLGLPLLLHYRSKRAVHLERDEQV
ncbi:hypothetical protein [Natrarchaeobaculum sulfurireducens]|uniref:Uncharacterized protein n=1 Tax=Natrarchaeobaculum sulfurireducens TaxID=2044521 RepID=A0A346PEK8_9EURY|nr:hypothetical protein [Natrarchaeobaculum sulfurireducens]AXR77953.1 hypothetical protein AArc1_1622 [Natrarchaeobaculum sulfurireducens]